MNINTKAAKKALKQLYDGKCTVTERQKVKDGNRTAYKELVTLKDEPCRISFSSFPPTAPNTNLANGLTQLTRLFIDPEVEIKAGSKITVTQNDVTADYKRSGEPAMYSTHQEVNLELFDKWA